MVVGDRSSFRRWVGGSSELFRLEHSELPVKSADPAIEFDAGWVGRPHLKVHFKTCKTAKLHLHTPHLMLWSPSEKEEGGCQRNISRKLARCVDAGQSCVTCGSWPVGGQSLEINEVTLRVSGLGCLEVKSLRAYTSYHL